MIWYRNKDAQSITMSFPWYQRGSRESQHLVELQHCQNLIIAFFFFLRKSNNSLISWNTSDYKSHWDIGEKMYFNIEGCWTLLTGNWIRCSALASTCQSLGELCWPCDNTWPPTSTETRKHVGGRLWSGIWRHVGAKVTHFQPQQLSARAGRLTFVCPPSLTEAESGFRGVQGDCKCLSRASAPAGLWQQPWVGAVTFDPNCKNDLNLHS